MNILKNRVINLISLGILHNDDVTKMKELSYNSIMENLYSEDLENVKPIEERLFRFLVEHNLPLSLLGDLEDDITVHEVIEDTLNYMIGEKFMDYLYVCIDSIDDDTFNIEVEHNTNILEYFKTEE